MAVPAHLKDNALQLQILNYREGPRRIGIFLCLAGMLAGGGVGELLRESMTAALRQHTVFTGLLNTPEVQHAIAVKSDAQSSITNEMIEVTGPWVKDLYWQDGHVDYFVLGDGSFVFDARRPPVWAFLLALLCPVFGFLIPWGVVKTLSWMGVEYFAKKQERPADVSP